MQHALYGPEGFFTSANDGPADHFRTSVHASPLFAGALLRLIEAVDAALGRPRTLQVVDVGAGRGELLAALHDEAARTRLADRLRLTAVEKAPRPARLPAEIDWQRTVPEDVVGVLLATEWLDNVPLDVAEVDPAGRIRRVLVDPADGSESLGGGIDAADRLWLARWWPGAAAGERVEVGWPRDVAWADAVSSVRRGCALTVDYGHLRDARPPLGTLTGFRGGRQVPPVPDGSCDVTAHVAVDAVAVSVGQPYRIITQREALKALGVDGARPSLDLARSDPAGYLRALSAAGAAAELTDAGGLGAHWWLLHEVGIDLRGSI
ncbi:SAM-dependent methyltransferase [Couchioplanes caeruleus]|uniref:SAM-dependent methyltransferase n=1 Tax=Couchioplanes caeruleus TaxID=56438 RepID=UPI0020BEED2D|nr:SAM-dependent methyltransferase [Couchioplanes caeruleus]UQU68354.1 SAM-dependent methyltransferase [Couchioplanes caeruleus]